MTDTTAESTTGPLHPPFVRPHDGRIVGGVCAGVAQRWQLDVTLVRIAAVVLALLSGVGLAAYLVAWLLTPSTDGPAPLQPGSRLARAVTARDGRGLHRLLVLILVVGVAALTISAVHRLRFGAPVGLLVVAAIVAVVVGTRLGRWTAAVVAALLAVALAAVGIFGDHLGTRTYDVASISDLQSSYDFGAGAIRLDLSGIGAVTGRHETAVHLGRGNVTVTVPSGVPTVVHARTGLGSVTIDRQRVGGIGAEQTRSLGPASGGDELVINVTVGVGSVTVRGPSTP